MNRNTLMFFIVMEVREWTPKVINSALILRLWMKKPDWNIHPVAPGPTD
jgi:hypothetical protein